MGEIRSWATIAEDLTDNSGSTPRRLPRLHRHCSSPTTLRAAAPRPQRLRFSGRNTTHDAIDVRGPDMRPRWQGGAPDACGRLL